MSRRFNATVIGEPVSEPVKFNVNYVVESRDDTRDSKKLAGMFSVFLAASSLMCLDSELASIAFGSQFGSVNFFLVSREMRNINATGEVE